MVLAIIILFLWVYFFIFNHPKCPVVRLPYENFKFKIGDIILFHALDNCLPLVIGTYYTHVGIALSDKLMFEAVNPKSNKLDNDGIVICDIEKRLSTYRGYIYVKPIEYCVKMTQHMLNLIHFSTENCYYNTNIFGNFLEKALFGEPIHRGLNCGELAFLSLVALGIVDKKKIGRVVHHLNWVANLEKGYLPLVQIEYSSFNFYSLS